MAEEARRRVVETTDDEDSKLVFETSEDVKVTRTFDQMKLKEDLVRGIYAYGIPCLLYTSPSPRDS